VQKLHGESRFYGRFLRGSMRASSLASRLDDEQDALLQIGHHRIRPQMRVPVKISGDAMPAGKMKSDKALADRLQFVLSAQHVEIRPADGDVLIERHVRNLIGLGTNRK